MGFNSVFKGLNLLRGKSSTIELFWVVVTLINKVMRRQGSKIPPNLEDEGGTFLRNAENQQACY
jgi:hypothetical protein